MWRWPPTIGPKPETQLAASVLPATSEDTLPPRSILPPKQAGAPYGLPPRHVVPHGSDACSPRHNCSPSEIHAHQRSRRSACDHRQRTRTLLPCPRGSAFHTQTWIEWLPALLGVQRTSCPCPSPGRWSNCFWSSACRLAARRYGERRRYRPQSGTRSATLCHSETAFTSRPKSTPRNSWRRREGVVGGLPAGRRTGSRAGRRPGRR